MNALHLIEQITDHIVEAKFRPDFALQKSEENSQPVVSDLIAMALKKRVSAQFISTEALDKAMEDSIKKYQNGEFLLPQLLVTAQYIGKARETIKGRNAVTFKPTKNFA